MASANSRHIERKWLTPIAEGARPPSTLNFPPEIPMRADWPSWAKFWLAHLGPGLALDESLGPWLHKSHRIWEWFYVEEEDALIHVDYEETVKYVRAGHHGTTRSRRGQYRRSPEAVNLDVGNGLTCSVGIKDDDLVLLLNTGPQQVEEAHATKIFIELLQSWGGAWM